MKNVVKLLSVLMVLCMLLSSCAQGVVEVANAIIDTPEENGAVNSVISNSEITNVPSPEQDKTENLSATTNTNNAIPEAGTYNEGVVLVKYDGEFTENVLAQLDFVSAEPLYMGSSWHTVTLGESMDTVEAVEYLNELGCFEKVDYDYIMGVTADTASAEVSGNPNYASQKNHSVHKIPEGWEEVKKNGKHPGGSPDVIVAVIDTGVDYNHLDLRNNIWVNLAEIPDNGIDDDGNGYIDDINGWDCVGDDNDPMDDNGHGTHVAGIIAAENNKIGGVGVAYNCKIMVLKAGSSSGYFNNSDIAEAIQYAYMNGASVINMSFAGSFISFAVEEALKSAYNTCVLVAAAGNDAICNQPYCKDHITQPPTPFYPAALPYVIGVMSTNADGSAVSFFSNFDHYSYNSYEYEVFAVGEDVFSTWPGNKYATLCGTSMSTPAVAGIAALLRSAYPDRETYSTKYLQSQIVNTGTVLAWEKSIANVYDALTKLPAPKVNLYNYYVFDNVEFSSKNDGDGVIDAGETIRIAIELQNRGGVASNVEATIDTFRDADATLCDPYFEFVNNKISLSDIGTYSVRDSELIYTDNVVTGSEKYFEIIVSENCPNDYWCAFNVNVSCTNGLDKNDTNQYSSRNELGLSVTNGVVLDYFYAEDTILPGNRRYIVAHNVTIAEGASLTFEAGAKIQFYEGKNSYYDTAYSTPTINGKIILNGTADNMIDVYVSELYSIYFGEILGTDDSQYIYTNFVNTSIVGGNLINSSINYNTFKGRFMELKNGIVDDHPVHGMQLSNVNITNSIIDASNIFIFTGWSINNLESSVLVFPSTSCGGTINNATNSLFVSHKSKFEEEERNYNTGNADEITIYDATNNVFLNETSSNVLKDYTILVFPNLENCTGNVFHGMYKTHPELLLANIFDEEGNLKIDVNDSTSQEISKIYPHISNIHIENADGDPIEFCGTEPVRFVVEFNRDMDVTKDTKLFFGSILPYSDYEISGEWVSARQWVGEYTLKATIENGIQRFRLENACTADGVLTSFNNASMYLFNIDTTAAMSMNLLANPLENGIELTFAQDDYDTLLGYNIYRSEEKDGNFVKLNPAILLHSESTFIDENAEPGKTSWYTYTVVLTDFSESNPAGKVQATAKDTMAPNMYHTPVNQGYLNNNLVISCTASDNVGIKSVVLYYRAVGAAKWKTLTMVKQNDKFSATIFGSDLTLDGIEYYIVAYDANNSIAKGSAEAPYKVVIKDASAISRKGDVDGDGVVTTKDALMLMQSINEERILTDDEFKRADLNNDGVLSSMEALRILQYINGNVNTLEM